MGLSWEAQLAIRPDLRIMVVPATLDMALVYEPAQGLGSAMHGVAIPLRNYWFR